MEFIIFKMEAFIVDFGKIIKDMETEYKFVQTEIKFKVFGKMENLLLDIFCVIDTIFMIKIYTNIILWLKFDVLILFLKLFIFLFLQIEQYQNKNYSWFHCSYKISIISKA